MIRILIVDDNEENLYLLRSILNIDSYTTVSARNGRDALAIAHKRIPDLIISDILMPVMDGYSFCSECKKDAQLKNIPFVFYTATYTNPNDEELAMHLGAIRFILKPQEPDEFLRIIVEVLEEVKHLEIATRKTENLPDTVVLKEYNEALVRKLEDKMLQTEKAELELRKYTAELEREIHERKKIEKSLRESEERFHSFCDEAVVGLYRTTPEGNIVMANRALLQMLGFSSVEELSKRNLVKKGFEDSHSREQFIEQIEKFGEIKDAEAQWKCRDGSIIYISESAKVIRDADGNSLFYDGIVEDITARKQAESALQESRQLFQTLALNSPVGIFRTRPDGYTTYVNPRWSELSGLSIDEALGYGWIKAVHPEDRIKLEQKWRENINKRDTSIDEYRFLRPDKSIVWVIGNAVPEIVGNNLLGYVGTITDVTELKVSEQQLRNLSRAVEQSPVLIELTDLNGNILYVNPKFEEVTGYKLGEVITENARILKSGETPVEEYKELWDTLLKGGTWTGQFHNKRKNGELYWESSVISPILNKKGEITNYLAVKEDITQRKESERELILAKEKAEEMNRLKSSLLANMSHELRTPLISILGYSELIQEEDLDSFIKDMAKNINNSGIRLLTTLNNLLQFSKMESENIKPKLGKIDINLLLKEVLNSFNNAIKNKGLSLFTEFESDTLYALSDKILLTEIFTNLLQNAIKFTLKGNIRVCTKVADDFIIIKVIDTGIGIPDEHQEMIFDEFRQVSEGLGRSFEGTGLGLTITKKFTKLLGGDISVESKVNSGSTFTLTLPNLHPDGLNKNQLLPRA
jgi:PAS domain S-box-containing protein